MLAIFLVSGCASSSVQSDEGEGEVREVIKEEASGVKESAERAEIQSRPAQAQGGGEYFYGILQERAHGVYDEMGEEFRECVQQFGAEGVIRELAMEVRREDRGGSFEIYQMETYPGGADCAEVVAEKYVETVGSSVFDDFDNYVLSVILRPAPGGECADAGRSEETVCVALDSASGAAGNEGDVEAEGAQAGRCAEELVNEVERALRGGRNCLAPSRQGERAFDEDRLRSRAVILGDVRVEEGMAHVVLRVHRPWARSIATCFSEGLIDVDVPQEQGARSCRTPLNNLAVSYSELPVFTFVD